MESEPETAGPESGEAPPPDPPKRSTRPFPRLTKALVPVLVGIVGAWLAIGLFRHKTVKQPFRIYAILWTLLSPVWLLVYWWATTL